MAASFQLNGTACSLIAAAGSPGWVALSDKTKMTYLYTALAASYKVCATNTGGSGKIYSYDSSVGGSVQSGAASMTTCI